MPPEPSFAPLALNESVSVDTPISRAANQTHSVTEKFSQWRSRLWGLCLVQLFLCMAFGVVYTELGYGATIFKGLNAVFHIRQIVGLVLLSCLGLFLCFEGYDTARWFHWTREWSARNYFALLVASALVSSLCIYALLSFQTHPYVPLMLWLIVEPVLYCCIKHFYPATHIANYMSTVGTTLTAVTITSTAPS
jgi:hypothetical protein